MNKIILALLLLALCTTVFAWDIVRQAAFPANFYGMDIIDNTVWACGSGGAVVKSMDSGNTWQFVPTPFFNAETATYRTVEDIDFADADRGVAVGGMGIVALTSDGGATWTYPGTAQTLIGTTELKSVVYLSDGRIWACGSAGMIAYSEDDGANWELQTAGISTILYGISMNAEGIGFIACNKGTPDQSKILKTNNGGTAWTLENLPVTGNPSIFNVRQFDNKVVLVGDFGYLGYSNDNGATWTHLPYAAGPTTTDELHDVVMNGDTGYAVGWNYRIITTTDGWATYSPVVHNFSASYMEGVVFNGAGNLVGCGWQGTLAVSSDGAVTWNDTVTNAIDIWQASILDADTWFMAGDKGNVLKTFDGGQTLIKKKIPGFDDILYACYFKNANEGWVSGKTIGKIYHTTDGGDNWTSYTVPGFSSTKSYYDFAFINDTVGYALGVGGKVVKTTDGGNNWALTGDNIGTTLNLYCSYWKTEQNGYAGSGSGALYITTNGGVTWTSITVGGSANIRDIWFRTPDNGVLVKENGEIWYTTTGGNTAGSWIAATESAVSQVNGVMCDHNGVFWAAGYSNETGQLGNSWALMKSLDYGATWTQESFPGLTFNATRFLDIGTGGGKIVAVGRNNLIVAQLEVPEHVSLLAPVDGSTGLDPSTVYLEWEPSQFGSQAAFYQVFVSTSSETIFDDLYYETTDTFFQLGELTDLDFDTTYYWAVLPVNEELVSPDIDSPAFDIWSFTTMSNLPGTPDPVATYNGSQVALNWTAVSGAYTYKIYASPTPWGTYQLIGNTNGTQYIYPSPGAMQFFKVVASTDL